ncbi:tetratricopeptide repeat protein [Clostridium hydrogenum]|uniref:tetratricopeptide repeat protein n=1 Tax=Clostridium hydrogenum TaxID=2855764 RepID=UPI001F30269B|nr:tetratricopeptide repeat protein [Clostridium hydrogenum]
MKTIAKVSIAGVIILIIAVFGYKIYIAHTANTSHTASTSNAAKMDDLAIIKEYGNLYGYVNKVDNEIFTVDKLETVKQGKGTMDKDTGKMVKFKCNKDTKLIKRTFNRISNSKTEAKDEAGSLSDIKVDKLVSVWGKSGADGTITAETVVVMGFN